MTELQLYKFCEDKGLDWRNNNTELILWIPFWQLEDFTKMIGYNYLSEGDVEVTLLDDCIALDVVDLCEHFDIEPENIMEKGN